jgi:hypothetical protein
MSKRRRLLVKVRDADGVVDVQAFAEAYARALLAELERQREAAAVRDLRARSRPLPRARGHVRSALPPAAARATAEGVGPMTSKQLKPQTNVRLSDEARGILDELSARWGMTASAVVEVLLRERAKEEGVNFIAVRGHGKKRRNT